MTSGRKCAHAMTVGISSLSNFVSRSGRADLVDEYGMDKWPRLPPDDPEQERIEDHCKRGDEVLEAVVEFIGTDSRAASAELNAFYRFTSLAKQGPEDIEEIAVFSTETGVGKLCALAVSEHLRRGGYAVRGPIELRGLGRGMEFLGVGLVEVVDKLVSAVISWKKTGLRAYVNATGGFKPETAFLTVASMLAGADLVYYTHETFGDVMILPSLPLTVDRSYADAISELSGGLPREVAEPLLQARGLSVEELRDRGLIEEAEGRVIPKEWILKLVSARSDATEGS